LHGYARLSGKRQGPLRPLFLCAMRFTDVLSRAFWGAGIFFEKGGRSMDTRIALIGILVEDKQSTEQMNRLLSDFGDYIVGRMGIPYRQKNVNVISVVVDAPGDVISALSGKLGMLPGVTTKTVYSKK